LNVNSVNNDRHTEMHTSENLVPEPSSFGFEISIENPKRYKSPDTDKIRQN